MTITTDSEFAFFAYAHNLAEVTRAVEVGKALRERGGEIKFFTHGGPFEDRIVEAGFSLVTLKPVITAEKHETLIGIDQGRVLRPPFSTPELAALVEPEVKLLREMKPAAVYAGFNLPCVVSARAAGIPLIWLIPTPAVPKYFEQDFIGFPDSRENIFTQPFPKAWKDRLFRWLVPRMTVGTGSFNKVGRIYGVPKIKRMLDLFSGDLNLIPDLPELSGLAESELPPGYHYVGPIFARLPLPIPNKVFDVFGRPGLKIYFAMGSSAQPDLFRKIALILRDSGHNVVMACTNIIDPAELEPLPDNVYAARFLPAHLVNKMADLAVIHGGQGTVQTALQAGTPIIGAALQYEQQANIETAVRAGAGVRLEQKDLVRETLLAAIDRVMTDNDLFIKADLIRQRVERIDGAARAAELIINKFS